MRRPLAAGALLLALYAGLSLLNDPRAYLGTDTGGKVATLKVMTERHRLDPDVGYWAERWDPEGRLHPLYYTGRYGHRWVNATTLPVLYAAYPLYRLGGYRLALLLPMLGSVAAALAAAALARRLSGGRSDSAAAFWVVGLASPLTIYALDFWEHSIGVALMAWGVVLLVDVVAGTKGPRAMLGAGLLFGVAATMRTEALVYDFVAVGGACLLLLWRRRPAAAVAGGLLVVAGLVVPLAANHALEVATVGQGIRFGRATGTASAAVATVGGSGTVAGAGATRGEEAMLNAAALTGSMEPLSYLLGFAVLALLAFACWRAAKPGGAGPAGVAAAGVALLYAVRFADGPGFVPGLVAATPIAVVGLVRGWGTVVGRYVAGVALAALPLVWATQFSGGAAPQWAGRYILVSGLLLCVTGVVALPTLPAWIGRGFVGLAVAVTAFGVVWTSLRTHQFADALATLNRRPEPVLVSRIGHLAREGGAFYGRRRWLTAPTEADLRDAVGVVEAAGIRRFAVVEAAGRGHEAPAFPGWRAAGRSRVTLVRGVPLAVYSYEAG